MKSLSFWICCFLFQISLLGNQIFAQSANAKKNKEIKDRISIATDFVKEPVGTGKKWTKIFEEEFNADLSQWDIWKGGAFNEELQHYQEENLLIEEGTLQIIARKEKVTGFLRPDIKLLQDFEFSSARIETKQTFGPSAANPELRIAARIKIARGYGMWSAFWAYGDLWPTKGEIDIMEARGEETSKYFTNYFYGNFPGQNLVNNPENSVEPGIDLSEEYHVYELIRGKEYLVYLLDGKEVDRKTGGAIPELFDKREKITLNLAVGGLFFPHMKKGNILPGIMYIDWVRAYVSHQ
ncbi:Glycosyl hydrolases family 16 [Pseudarcicella hirudinis]|uniref:Glycosyl hydrolases family 16 n=1 Tax=Pseudarcicella hirudinis TaxID=1079859 RepID=A0A1I5YGS5_9BACT|nr:glycoside hydrolase family 16 protein [Pseudarcicella hirudinis]SFQ43320.1 Glycosyl hydrolases family 16 [Pseudarcicella hirudinis]